MSAGVEAVIDQAWQWVGLLLGDYGALFALPIAVAAIGAVLVFGGRALFKRGS